MSRRRTILSKDRKAEADQSSMENDRTPTYKSNVRTAPYNLSGRDSVRQTGSSLTDTLGVKENSKMANPNYIYYRIYAEDGGIRSKTPTVRGYPFLGRIKAISVPPPRTVKVIKRSIATVENIKDEKVIFNGTGPGSTPKEPLALVARMSDSERGALESEGRGGLASDAEHTASQEIRYVYYLLYANNYEMPSKVAIDAEQPSLGRIRADSVAPPHNPTSIKRCISRVEGNPALASAYADLFADISCDTPLIEGHISILRTDGPGLSPNEPMAIVHVKPPSIPDGRYCIKNRAKDIYWNAIGTVYFFGTTMEYVKKYSFMQWNITQDTNGNISITSPYAPSSWVGADMTWSTVPVLWRLIPADTSKFYYLTTDKNRYSQNPRVPAAQEGNNMFDHGSMATLKEGDQLQMWEFIRI